MARLGHPFPRERVGRIVLRVEIVNQVGKLLFDDLRERPGIGVGIDQRQPAVADPLLERGKFFLALLRAAGGLGFPEFLDFVRDVALGQFAAFVSGHGRKSLRVHPIGRIAEVEERVPGHIPVVEHAVEDFQFGDGFPPRDMLFEPRFGGDDFGWDFVGNPAVALAEQPDEVGATALDLGQAERQDLAFRRLFLGDAPAQVDLSKSDEALRTFDGS